MEPGCSIMYSRYIKTVVDYIASFLALIILSPLFILTAFLIKTTSPGPIFFIQKRIGKNGKPFNLLKFRTMYLNNNRYHRQVVEGDPEITLIGNMLRKLKIDETPQLINVLLGEMSLVGPRPVMHHHLNDMTEGDIIRFEVKPGLTGLAAILT